MDVLINDKKNEVRYYVTKQGRSKDLDVLVHDKSWFVRYAIAEQGRNKDLDVFINDEDIILFALKLLNMVEIVI